MMIFNVKSMSMYMYIKDRRNTVWCSRYFRPSFA